MKNKFTIKKSIFINRSPETVWDFTQNYNLRTRWDKLIKEAKIVQQHPHKIVQLKNLGQQEFTFKYKQEKRPEKTSLALIEIKSFWIKGGGGSWVYEKRNEGTLWTQTNTLILRSGLIGRLAKPIFFWLFSLNIKQAMKRAKKIIETK